MLKKQLRNEMTRTQKQRSLVIRIHHSDSQMFNTVTYIIENWVQIPLQVTFCVSAINI